MAYTFLKVQGHETGSSRIDQEGLAIAKTILEKAKKKNITIYLPLDHVVASEFSENAKAKTTAGVDIESGWMGLDVGPKTVESFKKALSGAKMVLWNGPLGVFEFPAFANGSRAIAQFIASTKMISIIGGGDTAACIKEFGLEEKMSHISTGGGASLEYLEGQVLLGVAALQKKQAARSGV
jgi:3-phosphoglycerate kinase